MIKSRRRTSALILACVVTQPLHATPSGAAQAQPAAASAQVRCDRSVALGPLGTRMDEYLTRAVPYGFSGSVFVMDQEGVILHRAYGMANVARRIPNQIDTLFDMGSITKGFTATAIALLESEGRLSFGQRLSDYFPNAPADKRDITIQQLLTHTAGLIDLTNPNDYLVISREQFLTDLFKTPLLAPPGAQWSYSNAGYSVLAAIIEKLSGVSYERFLRDRLLAPAGMVDTGYRLARWSNDSADRSAHTYTPPVDHGSPLGRLRPTGGPHWILLGNGGMITTTADLCRFEAALRRGRPVAPPVQATLFAGRVERSATAKQGYAWTEENFPEGRAVHHGGDAPLFGLNAEFRRYPERHVTIGFLGTTRLKGSSSRHAIMRGLTSILFRGEVPRPPQVAAAPAAALRPLEGEYAIGSDSRLVIRQHAGHLLIGALGQEATDLLTFQRVAASQAARRERNAAAEDFGRALAASDEATLRRFVPEPAATSLITDLRAAEAKFGKLQGTRSMGTARLDRGVFRTTMRLDFARAPQVVRFVWGGGKISLNTDDENLATLGRVLAISPIKSVIEETAWRTPSGRYAVYDLMTDQIVEAEFVRAGRARAGAVILHLPDGPVTARRVR